MGFPKLKQEIFCFRVFLEKGHPSLVFRPGKKYYVFRKKYHLFRWYRKDHIFIFPCIFLRKIIFHFPPGSKIIFSGKRKIIFPGNRRKIKFRFNFSGKTIYLFRTYRKRKYGFPCSDVVINNEQNLKTNQAFVAKLECSSIILNI